MNFHGTKMLVLACCVASGMGSMSAKADECRVGFDVGSSGLRVGTLESKETAKTGVDFLADVWSDNIINLTVDATVEAMTTLPEKINKKGCHGVAGGYSAWRYAMEKGKPEQVVETLKEIQSRSGVYLFVIPQDVEGSYGYVAAKEALGDRLTTSHILDIGGGSMQIASKDGGWGTALGQKAWMKLFCEKVKQEKVDVCQPNPVGKAALETYQSILAPYTFEAKNSLKVDGAFAITAVSTNVVNTTLPVLDHLVNLKKSVAGRVTADGFDRQALQGAIALLSNKDDKALLATLDGCLWQEKAFCDGKFIKSFVTDMLLVHAFMEALGLDWLHVGQANITNIPGILQDSRPLAWSKNYPCYLKRLQEQGSKAFNSDPGTCEATP
ncbi:MAG: hypothetical protein G8345_16845 [Magnetococcales bacterium]|nr:hypothetical protein [Magnetococcales bacterium]NGZ28544.1 hypothetical protein [Magnetococcales bacterium]